MDPVTLSLIGSGISAISGLAQSRSNARSASALSRQEFEQSMELERMAIKEQLDANLKLADYQTERNLEFWNMQNEYNSPVQQMARFKKAGLNPALIYSQGSPGNASEMVKYQAPTASKANYRTKGEFMRANMKLYQDLRVSEAQIRQMELQNKMIEANIGKINAETQIIPTKGDLWTSQGLLNNVRSRKTDSDMHREQQLHSFKMQQANLTNHLLQKDLSLKDIAMRLNSAQVDYVKQLNKESQSKMNLNYDLGQYYDGLRDLNNSRRYKVDVDKDIASFTYENVLPQVVELKKAQIQKLVADGKISAAEASARSQKLDIELKNLEEEYKLKYQDNWSKFLGTDYSLKLLNAIMPF